MFSQFTSIKTINPYFYRFVVRQEQQRAKTPIHSVFTMSTLNLAQLRQELRLPVVVVFGLQVYYTDGLDHRRKCPRIWISMEAFCLFDLHNDLWFTKGQPIKSNQCCYCFLKEGEWAPPQQHLRRLPVKGKGWRNVHKFSNSVMKFSKWLLLVLFYIHHR